VPRLAWRRIRLKYPFRQRQGGAHRSRYSRLWTL
jgi:hypothetical protein